MKSPSEISNVLTLNQPFAAPSSRVLKSTVTNTESVTELFVDFSYIGVSLIDSVPQVYVLLRYLLQCSL